MDDEIKGEGNSINFKYRMHDPRVGRFFAVDPLSFKYPHYSPYAFSGNKVIAFTELEGLEEEIAIYNATTGDYDYVNKSQTDNITWLNLQKEIYSKAASEYHGGKALFYGYDEYMEHQHIDDLHYVLTPKTGTLLVDLSGNYPVYEFRDTDKKIRQGSGNKSIAWEAIKKYNWIYPVVDENSDYRDRKYAATIDKVQDGVGLFLGVTELKATGLAIWNIGRILVDIDDLTDASSNIKDNDLRAAVQGVKILVGIKNILNFKNDAIIDASSLDIKDYTGAALDIIDTTKKIKEKRENTNEEESGENN